MKRLAIVLTLLASPALAQQQTPTEQALVIKLNREIGENIGCSSALIQAQARIAELEKQLATAKEMKKERQQEQSPPQ
jgi:hypothetical protein